MLEIGSDKVVLIADRSILESQEKIKRVIQSHRETALGMLHLIMVEAEEDAAKHLQQGNFQEIISDDTLLYLLSTFSCEIGSNSELCPGNHSLEYRYSGLCVTDGFNKVTYQGETIQFTNMQHRVLNELIKNHGVELSKEYIYLNVLGREFGKYERSLDVHISNIRKKLRKAGFNSERIITKHGKGYCFK